MIYICSCMIPILLCFPFIVLFLYLLFCFHCPRKFPLSLPFYSQEEIDQAGVKHSFFPVKCLVISQTGACCSLASPENFVSVCCFPQIASSSSDLKTIKMNEWIPVVQRPPERSKYVGKFQQMKQNVSLLEYYDIRVLIIFVKRTQLLLKSFIVFFFRRGSTQAGKSFGIQEIDCRTS